MNNLLNALSFVQNNNIVSGLISLVIRVVITIVVAIIACIIIKLLSKAVRRALVKAKVDEGVIGFITSFISIALYLIVAFFIASSFGVDAATIVALLGSCGVAIGLAVQGSLSNLAGGVLLLILHPFKIGDYIIEDSNKNEGTVKEIGLFYTKLQTLDDRTVILPNGTLANTSITNVTHTPNRMIELKFVIAYNADLDAAYEVIKQVITEDEAVLQDKGVEAYMTNLLDSGVEIAGRFYVKNKNYRFARQRILEGVKRGFDEKHIEIPYPQIVIHKAN